MHDILLMLRMKSNKSHIKNVIQYNLNAFLSRIQFNLLNHVFKCF